MAIAAGAAAGLQQFLMRELAQMELEERQRSNQADEGFRDRQLGEQTALRKEQQRLNDIAQQRLLSERGAQERNRVRDDLRGSLDDLGLGSRVSVETRNQAVDTGAAVPERFKGIPNPDFVGPTLPQEPREPSVGEMMGYELQGAGKVGVDPQSQQSTFKLDGKPVEGSYIPGRNGQGRYFYRGEDVTNRVEHYERPRQEDRVLIQTGGGYMTRPDAAATLAAGGEVPLPDTAETRNKEAAMQRVQPFLNVVKRLNPKIATKPGMAQIFEGGWRTLKAKAKEDVDVAAYVRTIEAFTPLFARALGHVGVLTEQDYEHSMRALPTPFDPPEVATELFSIIDEIMGGGGQAAEAAGGGDLYNEYLKRTQPKP